MEQLLIIFIPISIENHSDDKYFFVKSSNLFYRHILAGPFVLLHPVFLKVIEILSISKKALEMRQNVRII